MPFCLIDLLCFLVVVLVVVAFGDLLVAWIVGEVLCCDLCDPCMMLSCAFILVRKRKKDHEFSPRHSHLANTTQKKLYGKHKQRDPNV